MPPTIQTYASLEAWAAGAGTNEYRYAETHPINTLTALGIRINGGATNDTSYAPWHEVNPPSATTDLMIRSRIRGTWTRRSSRYAVLLGRIRGDSGVDFSCHLYNHAKRSGGVSKDRVWFSHFAINPGYTAPSSSNARTTPGPLIADVFNGADFDINLRVTDLGNPDGDGKHDVRFRAWGGPTGGTQTVWVDFTAKLSAPLFGVTPNGFAASYVQAPTVISGEFAGYPPTVLDDVRNGEGPSELIGASGDELILRNFLVLDGLTCAAAFPAGTPPVIAPLALPSEIKLQFDQQLTFIPGSAEGPYDVNEVHPVFVAEVYRRTTLDGDGDFASNTTTESTITSTEEIGWQAWVQAGALSLDVSNRYPASAYVTEVTISDLTVFDFVGPHDDIGENRYRFPGIMKVPSGGFIGPSTAVYFSASYAVNILSGPDPTKTTTISNVRARRYAVDEGY